MFCYAITAHSSTHIIRNIEKRIEPNEIILVRSNYIFTIYNEQTRSYLNRPKLIEINKDELGCGFYEFCTPEQYDKILVQKNIKSKKTRLRKHN